MNNNINRLLIILLALFLILCPTSNNIYNICNTINKIDTQSGSTYDASADSTSVKFKEAQEDSAVAKAERNIEIYRKGEVELILKDKNGRILKGIDVYITQISSDFLFGCNTFMFDQFKDPLLNNKYKSSFKKLFNYATIGTFWRSYEYVKGKPKYDLSDTIVNWCSANGIMLQTALLSNNKFTWPDWLISDSVDYKKYFKERIRNLLKRYKNKIKFWNVLNEPFHSPGISIDTVYKWAHNIAPNNKFVINEFYILYNGYPKFYTYLLNAIDRRVPFQIIGMQAHDPESVRFYLPTVDSILNHYGELGKDIHITEFTPTSDGSKINNYYMEGIWNEKSQAEYASKFYKICFGNRYVKAISWWDLTDYNSWRKNGGLLRTNLSEKPVYDSLYNLINNKWRTNISTMSNNYGIIKFRGFSGLYKIACGIHNKVITQLFSIESHKVNKIILTIK